MQNKLNDIELNCFVRDVNLNGTFLFNCSRKYRQCPYYHSHSIANGGHFENKQITKKCSKVTRCHHSVIVKRSLKHFVHTTSMFHLCSAILAHNGTCFLDMVSDNPVVLLLMHMFVYQFKLVIIVTILI